MDKERQSNYELLRLILMFMIVAQHIINNGVLSQMGGHYTISVLAGSLGTFLEVAVNSFVLISGYFMIKFHIKKVLRLLLDMVVIGEVVYILAVIVGYKEFHVTDAIYFLMPIHWWFIVYYIILMFLAPYLNCLVDVMDKKQFARLIILLFLVLSVAPTFFDYDFGGGVSNFIFMYLIGRFLRLHVREAGSGWFWLTGYLVCSVLSALGDWYLHTRMDVAYTWGIKFFQSYSVFIVLASVCFFSMFRNIQIKSRMINRLAKSALGVYVIHEHPLVREFYLEKFKVLTYVNGPFEAWLKNLLITCVLVYGACLVIETVRIMLFDSINNKLCDIIAGCAICKKLFP